MVNEGRGNAPGIPELAGPVVSGSEGLDYIEEEAGDGPGPQTGNTVTVHYTGWLTDGKKFDSSRDRGEPFDFVIGIGQVISGWDIGVASMKVGGKCRLLIPASLGYGSRGAPPVIPPDAALIFDVELIAIG